MMCNLFDNSIHMGYITLINPTKLVGLIHSYKGDESNGGDF